MKANGRVDRIREFVRAQKVAPTDAQIAEVIGEPLDRVAVTTRHLTRTGIFADNGKRRPQKRYTEIVAPDCPEAIAKRRAIMRVENNARAYERRKAKRNAPITFTEQIRACIAVAGKPLTIREIASMVGADIVKTRNSCFNMARGDILVKVSRPHYAQRFDLGRDLIVRVPSYVKPRGRTDEQKRADRAARIVKANLMKAAREAKAEERNRQQAERLAQQKLREENRAKAAQAQLAEMARNATRRSAKQQPSVASRANIERIAQPAETVEQWMARTGAKPVVLCRHATAQPFERIRVAA